MRYRLFALVATSLLWPQLAFSETTFDATVERSGRVVSGSVVLPVSAEQVWQALAIDYDRVALSHPRMTRSVYKGASTVGGLGAERICYFNGRESRYLHEEIVYFNANSMEMTNSVTEAKGVPLDTTDAKALYSVEALAGSSSRLTVEMTILARPRFITGIVARQFEDVLSDFFLAFAHHLTTGEVVNRDNFAETEAEYR